MSTILTSIKNSTKLYRNNRNSLDEWKSGVESVWKDRTVCGGGKCVWRKEIIKEKGFSLLPPTKSQQLRWKCKNKKISPKFLFGFSFFFIPEHLTVVAIHGLGLMLVFGYFQHEAPYYPILTSVCNCFTILPRGQIPRSVKSLSTHTMSLLSSSPFDFWHFVLLLSSGKFSSSTVFQ